MPLKQAKCTNCNQTLQVDNSEDATICKYCGKAFIIEKAINNYNISNNICDDNINYLDNNLNDFIIRGGVLEKYTGAATKVIIPNMVSHIGCGAFQGCLGITDVVIPNSVENICYSAFENCSKLKRIVIPANVKVVEPKAFYSCSNLEEVIISEGVEIIGSWAFKDCVSLKSIVLPDSVKEIGESIFCECVKLNNVRLSNNLLYIPDAAFEHCSMLKNIEVPESINKIVIGAFTNSGLEEMTFFGNKTITFVVDPEFRYKRFPETLNCINASEEWKKNNYHHFKCLSEYQPKQTNNSSGGCYIATAVYGSYDCPQVCTLRRYRDYRLLTTWYGKLFVDVYYAVSPSLVKWFGKTQLFNKFLKNKLDKLVIALQKKGFENTPYNDKKQ